MAYECCPTQCRVPPVWSILLLMYLCGQAGSIVLHRIGHLIGGASLKSLLFWSRLKPMYLDTHMTWCTTRARWRDGPLTHLLISAQLILTQNLGLCFLQDETD